MHRALQRSTDIFDRFSNTQGQEPRKKGFPKKKYLKTTCNLEQKKGIEEIVCAEGGGRPIIIFGYHFSLLFDVKIFSFGLILVTLLLTSVVSVPQEQGKPPPLLKPSFISWHVLRIESWSALRRIMLLILLFKRSYFSFFFFLLKISHFLSLSQIVRNWPFKTEKKEAIFRMNGFMRDPRNVPEDVQKVTHRDNVSFLIDLFIYFFSIFKNFLKSLSHNRPVTSSSPFTQ